MNEFHGSNESSGKKIGRVSFLYCDINLSDARDRLPGFVIYDNVSSRFTAKNKGLLERNKKKHASEKDISLGHFRLDFTRGQ